MDAMLAEDLPGARQNIESLMIPRLHELAEQHPQIGDVRGRGAMLAIEIVEPGTRTADAAEAGRISSACHQRGVRPSPAAPTATCCASCRPW